MANCPLSKSPWYTWDNKPCLTTVKSQSEQGWGKCISDSTWTENIESYIFYEICYAHSPTFSLSILFPQSELFCAIAIQCLPDVVESVKSAFDTSFVQLKEKDKKTRASQSRRMSTAGIKLLCEPEGAEIHDASSIGNLLTTNLNQWTSWKGGSQAEPYTAESVCPNSQAAVASTVGFDPGYDYGNILLTQLLNETEPIWGAGNMKYACVNIDLNLFVSTIKSSLSNYRDELQQWRSNQTMSFVQDGKQQISLVETEKIESDEPQQQFEYDWPLAKHWVRQHASSRNQIPLETRAPPQSSQWFQNKPDSHMILPQSSSSSWSGRGGNQESDVPSSFLQLGSSLVEAAALHHRRQRRMTELAISLLDKHTIELLAHAHGYSLQEMDDLFEQQLLGKPGLINSNFFQIQSESDLYHLEHIGGTALGEKTRSKLDKVRRQYEKRKMVSLRRKKLQKALYHLKMESAFKSDFGSDDNDNRQQQLVKTDQKKAIFHLKLGFQTPSMQSLHRPNHIIQADHHPETLGHGIGTPITVLFLQTAQRQRHRRHELHITNEDKSDIVSRQSKILSRSRSQSTHTHHTQSLTGNRISHTHNSIRHGSSGKSMRRRHRRHASTLQKKTQSSSKLKAEVKDNCSGTIIAADGAEMSVPTGMQTYTITAASDVEYGSPAYETIDDIHLWRDRLLNGFAGNHPTNSEWRFYQGYWFKDFWSAQQVTVQFNTGSMAFAGKMNSLYRVLNCNVMSHFASRDPTLCCAGNSNYELCGGPNICASDPTTGVGVMAQVPLVMAGSPLYLLNPKLDDT